MDPRPLEPSSDWSTRWLEQKEFVDGRDALKAPYFERIKRALLKIAAVKQQRRGALEAEELLEARVWYVNEGVASRRSTDDKKRRHEKDFKQWPLWEDQVRLRLRGSRGASGLPLHRLLPCHIFFIIPTKIFGVSVK